SGTSAPPATPGSGVAEAMATAGSTPDKPPMPAKPPQGFVVQHRDGPQVYNSLSSAYAAVRNDEFIDIELRFDGVRREKPLTFEKNVTLRAADGYRPTLAFDHDPGRG